MAPGAGRARGDLRCAPSDPGRRTPRPARAALRAAEEGILPYPASSRVSTAAAPAMWASRVVRRVRSRTMYLRRVPPPRGRPASRAAIWSGCQWHARCVGEARLARLPAFSGTRRACPGLVA
ncbi:hypothetical protein HYPSUDRAFT_197643 [Hypholoma sublateritium FD-334 SS-4]|uniref:Uncharacterized protein n=1 Tax=Hypholoma sublateritium (strain FD-334 SS-4) TaxID=945553 RepID=A0A0D2PB42_HYPSF|nr:hypothetical protein HYPSUDRAFT_197643 [Hypholoma sublateritium FD-334 SS-4]